jgi:plasmid stability protein
VKNVTIKLDERTAAWVRVYAARHNTSVSRIVGDMLAEKMQSASEYDRARRRFMSQRLRPLTEPGERFTTREQIHDRRGIR